MSGSALFSFVGGDTGPWRVERTAAVAGPGLPDVARVRVEVGDAGVSGTGWVLRAVTSNMRYTTRGEADGLASRQEGLGRGSATRAALIPIRKSAAWWALAQDERRAVFEAQSRHIGIGMAYLPAVARRLHHSRELGEPFDFVTWFEFAPEDEGAFDAMLVQLRGTAEWSFVEREVDIRLALAE